MRAAGNDVLPSWYYKKGTAPNKEMRIISEKLLKRLTELTKLSYISDLHGGASGRIISKALHEIKPEEYSREEWEYAIGYILGQTQHFESREAALQYLYEQLNKIDQ